MKHGSTLVRELALGSVVLAGFVPGAHLPPLSKQLVPPLPPHRMQGDRREEVCTTLAAGENTSRTVSRIPVSNLAGLGWAPHSGACFATFPMGFCDWVPNDLNVLYVKQRLTVQIVRQR